MEKKIYLVSVVKNQNWSIPINGFTSKKKLWQWLKDLHDPMAVNKFMSYKTFSEKLKGMMLAQNYQIAVDQIYKIQVLPINPE